IIGPAGTDVSGIAENFQAGGAAAIETKEEAKPAESKAETAEAPKAEAVNNDGGRVFVSPLARKIAEEKGINLNQVKGTGENGRIVKKDVESFTPGAAAQPAQAAQPSAAQAAPVAQPFIPAGEVSKEEVKNNQMRKTIARRLAESKFTAPEYSLTIEL